MISLPTYSSLILRARQRPSPWYPKLKNDLHHPKAATLSMPGEGCRRTNRSVSPVLKRAYGIFRLGRMSRTRTMLMCWMTRPIRGELHQRLTPFLSLLVKVTVKMWFDRFPLLWVARGVVAVHLSCGFLDIKIVSRILRPINLSNKSSLSPFKIWEPYANLHFSFLSFVQQAISWPDLEIYFTTLFQDHYFHWFVLAPPGFLA